MAISVMPDDKLHIEVLQVFYPTKLSNLILRKEWQAYFADGLPEIVPLERTSDAIRAMLRAHGYKPSGRGKPSSEYLRKAVTEGTLPSINVAVDLGNIASFHSGIPISVVDIDCLREEPSVRPGAAGENYIFNNAGQTIDVQGLWCLCDSVGPCANAVKDAMRTKTSGESRRTIFLLWGAREVSSLVDQTLRWLEEETTALGATSRRCELQTTE